jgi:hypothetical protein
MVPHFREKTYGDVKMPGYNVWGHIVRELNIWRHNAQGLFWILGRGLRRALIRCTLGSGKSEKGMGFWRGGHKGAMGDKGE